MVDHNSRNTNSMNWGGIHGYTMGIPHLHYRFPSYDSWPCLKQVHGPQPLAASLTRADGSAECHCVGYMRQRMDWEAIELMKSALPLHAWPSVKLWQEYISLWNIPLNDSRFNFPDSVLTASSGWAAIRFTTWKRRKINSLVSFLSTTVGTQQMLPRCPSYMQWSTRNTWKCQADQAPWRTWPFATDDLSQRLRWLHSHWCYHHLGTKRVPSSATGQ